MHPGADADLLRRTLLDYRSPYEDVATRAALVDAGLTRIAETLALLPDAGAESHLLELGAPPFLTTVCLEHAWPGRLTLAGYAATNERRIAERLVSADGSREKVYEFDVFNIETDEFPYPDATFDVVIAAEIIEHLALNPVWALAEIHRVLRPGGRLIITTPNALSLDRLDVYLHGGSPSVDRYVPVLGYGARHNREWHPEELRDLLVATGFVIEHLVVRDLDPFDRWTWIRRVCRRLVLRLVSSQSHHGHIVLRARRGDVFRWAFPPRLFDHTGFYRIARHPWIEMGINDSIQCGGGWLEAEPDSDRAGTVRRIDGDQLAAGGIAFATAYLRARPGATRVVVELCAHGRNAASDIEGHVRLRSSERGDEVLPTRPFTVPAGTWAVVESPLTRHPAGEEVLDFDIRATPGTVFVVRRIALEP
jgi:SAM-dependent methyltransferase